MTPETLLNMELEVALRPASAGEKLAVERATLRGGDLTVLAELLPTPGQGDLRRAQMLLAAAECASSEEAALERRRQVTTTADRLVYAGLSNNDCLRPLALRGAHLVGPQPKSYWGQVIREARARHKAARQD